jgi:hypothetical protein
MAGLKNVENSQWGRVYADLAVSPAYPDNSGREPSVDPYGALWVRIAGGSPAPTNYASKALYRSAALLASGLVYTGSCDMLEFYGFKDGSISGYIHRFDAVALPANGVVPLIVIPVKTTDTIFSLSQPPLNLAAAMFTNGIFFAASSTIATLTYDATQLLWINALTGNY